MAKRKDTQVVSLDTFGSAKSYWTVWVRSQLAPLAFAKGLWRDFRFPCAYIGDFMPEADQPQLKFPMYFQTFNQEFDVCLVTVANHVTAPMELSLGQQNPLLGGLLFEDDYFLFNNQGLKKITFSHPQADYILLLSADKDADMDDYLKLLPLIKDASILCEGDPQEVARGQKKSKSFLDFLQYLFYESEVAVKEYRQNKLLRRLHRKMSVAEANYGRLKFPMDDNRMITSDLLRREDF